MKQPNRRNCTLVSSSQCSLTVLVCARKIAAHHRSSSHSATSTSAAATAPAAAAGVPMVGFADDGAATSITPEPASPPLTCNAAIGSTAVLLALSVAVTCWKVSRV